MRADDGALVSIIVPIYNDREYIAECVKQLCGQTYRNIEIILVDDGSTDGSGAVLDSYEDERIRVVHKEHGGVSRARNAGLEIAQGRYIMFADADDRAASDMVERLLTCAAGEQADVAVCRHEKIYPDGTAAGDGGCDEILRLSGPEALVRVNYGSGITASVWDKIYRAECLEGIRFPEDVRIGEDYSFIADVFMKAGKVVAIPDILYYYVQRRTSVCHQGFTLESYGVLDNYLSVYQRQKERLPELAQSALVYLVLQEMAIIVSMTKAEAYDSGMIRNVASRVRQMLGGYLRDKRVPFFLKVCAVMIAFAPRLFIWIYRVFFSRKRDRAGGV